MTIPEFVKKYSLYGSIITAWNWAESHRLVLEVDLSNLNQSEYKEEDSDFRSIIIILENCITIDELREGFDGFSNGDARIIEANEVKKSGVLNSKYGIKLVMMHDKYDGTDEKLISIIIAAENLSVTDPDK